MELRPSKKRIAARSRGVEGNFRSTLAVRDRDAPSGRERKEAVDARAFTCLKALPSRNPPSGLGNETAVGERSR
jgi:hypothetical protein